MSKKNPSVLWNVDQSLAASEKAKARENIGVSLANNEKSGSALTFVTGTSETDGVINLNLSDVKVSNSYNSTSTDPASGQAIAAALDTLDVSMPTDADTDNSFVKFVKQTDGTVEQHRQQPQIADISGLSAALDFTAGTDLIRTGKEFKVNTSGNDYKSTASISYSFVTGASTHTPHSYSFAGGYNSIAGGFTISGPTPTYTPSPNDAAGGAGGTQTMFSFGNSCRVNMCDAFSLGCNNTIIDDKDGNTRGNWYGETGSGALGAGNTISNAYHAITIGNNNTIYTGCHNSIAIGNDNTFSTGCHHNILIGQVLNSCGGDVPHLILGTFNDTASNAAGWGLTAGSLSRITGGGDTNNRINIEELTWTGLLWTRQGFSTSIGVPNNYVNDASMFIDSDSSLPAFRLRHGKYTNASNYQEVSLYATNTEIGLWRNDKGTSSGDEHEYSRSVGFRNLSINNDYVPVMEFGDTYRSDSVEASKGTTGFVQMPQKTPAHPTGTNYSATRLKLYGDRGESPLSALVSNLQVGTLTVRFINASDCATEATALLPSYQLGELTFIYNDYPDALTQHDLYMHCGDDRDPNDPETVVGYMYHYPITNYCAPGKFTIFATSVAAGTNQGGEIINYGYFSQLAQ